MPNTARGAESKSRSSQEAGSTLKSGIDSLDGTCSLDPVQEGFATPKIPVPDQSSFKGLASLESFDGGTKTDEVRRLRELRSLVTSVSVLLSR